MANKPAINGREFVFSSITANIDGEEFFGFLSINYATERETSGLHGNSPQQIGTVTGNLTHTGDFELTKRGAQRLRRKLGQGYMDKVFTLNVTYRETSLSELITDTLQVQIKNDSTSGTAGADAIKDKFELHVSSITRGGIKPVAEE